MNKIIPIILLLFLFSSCKTSKNETQKSEILVTENKSKFPEYLGYVSDYEKVFSNQEINDLSKILSDYKAKTTNEIAIISISENLNDSNFDQYALDLSNHWGIGDPIKDNGLTIVFSKKLRKIRICTGIGTEKILTDEICEQVLNEKMIPEFKKENYFSGLKSGVNEFIKIWK